MWWPPWKLSLLHEKFTKEHVLYFSWIADNVYNTSVSLVYNTSVSLVYNTSVSHVQCVPLWKTSVHKWSKQPNGTLYCTHVWVAWGNNSLLIFNFKRFRDITQITIFIVWFAVLHSNSSQCVIYFSTSDLQLLHCIIKKIFISH